MPTHFETAERDVWTRDRDGILTTYKHEDSSETYVFDLSGRLDGATISSVAWEASGVTVAASSNTTTTCTVRVTGTSGSLKRTIVTSGSETWIDTLRFLEAASGRLAGPDYGQ
jgi:hypothetical protein